MHEHVPAQKYTPHTDTCTRVGMHTHTHTHLDASVQKAKTEVVG